MAFLHLLFLLFLHFSKCEGEEEAEQFSKCEGGSYSADSTFGSNVKLLLSNFSSSNSIFSTATIGVSPERVYGLVLCRGDQDPSSCTTCFKMVSHSITQLCPYSKEATMWDRNCELRYSDMLFFDYLGPQNVYEVAINTGTSDTTFANMSRELFQHVSYQAAFNSSLMFATGMLSFHSNESTTILYSLAQCTRDLSGNQCSQCLNQTLEFYWSTFRLNIGAWFPGYSCNYRYEVAPFYAGDPTIVLSLPLSPPPTPLVSPPTSGEAANQSRGGKKNTGKVIAIVISLAVGLVLVFALLICFRRRSKNTTYGNTEDRNSGNMEDILSAESLLFDLRTLKVATDNFSDSNMLGRGGFGAVYKGTLLDGEEIAVKRLSESSRQGLEELKNELLLIAKLQHKNLVRLMGVCLEEEEKSLVYEYAPNRSLDTFLFDPIKRLQLSWERRFEIIGGIARGLRYLHEESHLRVIHRDMKASNILLDENLSPKISDFGLARLFGVNETQHTTTRVVGTLGYMAPEYAMRGQFSTKMDVYSFGVLVLEIVSGRKNNHEHGLDILSYTWAHWSEDTTLEIVDPSLGDEFSTTEALRCIQIGLLCVQDVPANRPVMSSVVLMLQSPSIALQPPLQPILGAGTSSTSSTVSAHRSDLSSTDRSASRSVQMSVNDVTISECHPR